MASSLLVLPLISSPHSRSGPPPRCTIPRWLVCVCLQIFSTYGFVQKIHIFEREGRTVALVQYADVATADTARGALQGHAMYDGGHNVVSGGRVGGI